MFADLINNNNAIEVGRNFAQKTNRVIRRATVKGATVSFLGTNSGKVSAAGAATSIYYGISSDILFGILGVLFSLFGVLISYFFQLRKDKRDQQERDEQHAANMAEQRRLDAVEADRREKEKLLLEGLKLEIQSKADRLEKEKLLLEDVKIRNEINRLKLLTLQKETNATFSNTIN